MTQPGANQDSQWELARTEATVEKEQEGRLVTGWPSEPTREFVSAMVLNEATQALILEGFDQVSGRHAWQLPGGRITTGEDPLLAVQRTLQKATGYSGADWSYLGSYVIDPQRQVDISHLFCVQNVPCGRERRRKPPGLKVRWVSVKDLRYGLLDGRLSAMRDATVVALALLTLL